MKLATLSPRRSAGRSSARAAPPSSGDQVSAYLGGVRWRKWNATWPFARLVIDPAGVTVRPSLRGLRFLGVPTLGLHWSEVEAVEQVRGALPLPQNAGVSFIIKGKRLVFWCSASVAAAIIEEAGQYVPEKVVSRQSPKVIF